MSYVFIIIKSRVLKKLNPEQHYRKYCIQFKSHACFHLRLQSKENERFFFHLNQMEHAATPVIFYSWNFIFLHQKSQLISFVSKVAWGLMKFLQKSYLKTSKGGIEHWVSIETPSIWQEFFCVCPCQCIEVELPSSILFSTHTCTVSPLHT